METFLNTFKNKKVLVTGHTGFKGSWLSIWLQSMGAKVVGVSIDSLGSESNFEVSAVKNIINDKRADITDLHSIKKLIREEEPDFIFHLAAQSLVRKSYENPVETMLTNAMGSVNVLQACRFISKDIIVVLITSDKAYDNVEWVCGYRETDGLGGEDPYSASKGMAELAIKSYASSFFDSHEYLRLGIARAGNVIGGGDWAIDRVVPDCMRAWSRGDVVKIRNPHATRPWQHVLEPLSGYLNLAIKLNEDKRLHKEAFNFGPSSDQNYPVSDLIDGMSAHWAKVQWTDVSNRLESVPEAGLLKLNCDKANLLLNWKAALNFNETLEFTVEWYRKYYDGGENKMYDYSISQIEAYTSLAKSRGIEWAI